MAIDERLADEFARRKAAADARRGPGDTSGVGGGDEPPHDPGMETRVAKLEDALQGINIALATMTEQLRHLATKADLEQVRTEIQAVRADTASLAGKLDGKAAATDLAELKGRVGRIPTVPMLTGLLALTTASSRLGRGSSTTIGMIGNGWGPHLPHPKLTKDAAQVWAITEGRNIVT